MAREGDGERSRGLELVRALGPASVALVVGVMGAWYNCQSGTLQRRAHRTEVYTQLLAQRERADSELRATMFKTLFDAYFSKGVRDDPSRANQGGTGQASTPAPNRPASAASSTEEAYRQILFLDLLARNFETIDIKPILEALDSELSQRSSGDGAQGGGADAPPEAYFEARDLLRRKARSLAARQVHALASLVETKTATLTIQQFCGDTRTWSGCAVENQSSCCECAGSIRAGSGADGDDTDGMCTNEGELVALCVDRQGMERVQEEFGLEIDLSETALVDGAVKLALSIPPERGSAGSAGTKPGTGNRTVLLDLLLGLLDGSEPTEQERQAPAERLQEPQAGTAQARPTEIPRTPRFSVTFYDLPFIDNTRLFTEDRLAVVLEEFFSPLDHHPYWRSEYFETSRAEAPLAWRDYEALGTLKGKGAQWWGLPCRQAKVKLIKFPKDYLGLRDRPYVNEILKSVLEEEDEG